MKRAVNHLLQDDKLISARLVSDCCSSFVLAERDAFSFMLNIPPFKDDLHYRSLDGVM